MVGPKLWLTAKLLKKLFLVLIHSFIYPLNHSSIHSFIHPLIHLFIHPSIHPFIHPFIHSINHSFIIFILCRCFSSTRPSYKKKSVKHRVIASFLGDSGLSRVWVWIHEVDTSMLININSLHFLSWSWSLSY